MDIEHDSHKLIIRLVRSNNTYTTIDMDYAEQLGPFNYKDDTYWRILTYTRNIKDIYMSENLDFVSPQRVIDFNESNTVGIYINTQYYPITSRDDLVQAVSVIETETVLKET